MKKKKTNTTTRKKFTTNATLRSTLRSTRLKQQQRLFCELYASSEEFFGNGVQSYIEAYNIDLSKKGTYKSARTCAWRLLTNVDVLAYINKLLDLTLNDVYVDKQLAFLITQNAELNTKLGAIKEYNQLKSRIKDRMAESVDTLAQALHRAKTAK